MKRFISLILLGSGMLVFLVTGCTTWPRPDTPLEVPDHERVGPPPVTVEYLEMMAADYRRQMEEFQKPPKEAAVDPKDRIPPEPDVDQTPPEGSQSHTEKEPPQLTLVRTEPERRKLDEPKRSAEVEGSDVVKAPEWRMIGFSSGFKRVGSGLDPRLLQAHKTISGRDYTFAMLLLNEYLTPKIEGQLKKHDVELLDRHSSAFKARLPLDPETLKRIVEEEFVEWIGYPDAKQKIEYTLAETLARFGRKVKQFPVYINLFHEFDRKSAERFISEIHKRDLFYVTYHEDLGAVQALVSKEELQWLVDRDYVLFIELDSPVSGGHDQSTPTIGADYIRTGGSGSRFSGSPIIVGIMDSGFMVGSAAATLHNGLNKFGCGRNFTSDTAGVWNDEHDHGTHVLGTIGGTGAGDNRYRGMATGIGSSSSTRIRAAKVLDSNNSGSTSWMNNGLEYMRGTKCDSARPLVTNLSAGGGTNLGTDSMSRRVDANTWDHKILNVIITHNFGPGRSTSTSPGNAKTSLTVGNVIDTGFRTVGDINNGSGRGPTADDRMKPNVVAVGTDVMSANAGTASDYRSMTGTSMAAPHVTGLAATLMHHYSWLRDRPFYIRAHIMATALLHDDDVSPRDNDTNGRNTYGLGRVSSYVSHWARGGSSGWGTALASRTITNSSWGYRDINVPAGTERLVVVMTWDEDAASSGASEAVKYDLDLWVDRGANCTGDGGRQCGEWNSISYDDNVEYVIVNDPSPGTYRIKIVNWDAPSSGLPAGFAATVIRGDTTPAMTLNSTPSSTSVSTGATFTVTTNLTSPDFIASGVQLENTFRSGGVQFLDATTTREDGVTMTFTQDDLTLGNIRAGDTRSITWRFRKTTGGSKNLIFRAWSENGGEPTNIVTIN